MWASYIDAAEDERRADVSLVSVTRSHLYGELSREADTYWKSICLSIVIAVTTRGFRPVERACNSMFDEMSAVVNSVSAAVPAPQQRIDSVM